MTSENAFYAQSGGVTAVINASVAAVIEACRENSGAINRLYAGHNGILGALNEELIDTGRIRKKSLANMRQMPGGIFGSCRYKLGSFEDARSDYERLISVFQAHNIRYFFYNGGNDSADTAHKISKVSRLLGHEMRCIAIPKTVDNDLMYTDCCPGFGSAAKYVAVATREAALDVVSMSQTSTRVFILEVMGRHAGWLAASAGLGRSSQSEPPHLILFPERAFDAEDFLKHVDVCVKQNGYCVVVASEGIRDASGRFVSEGTRRDAFGHVQLGGVAPRLAALASERLGHKTHWAVADYLQRSARHIASQTDYDQAIAVGRAAVEYAVSGMDAVMPIIKRHSDQPYRWSVDHVSLKRVANRERKVPKSYIRRDGYGITQQAMRYLLPLIAGEAYPSYKDGLPIREALVWDFAPKKLAPWSG